MADFIIKVKDYLTSTQFIHIAIGLAVFFILFILRNKISKAILSTISKIIFKRDKKELKRSLFINSLLKPLAYFISLSALFIALKLNINSLVIIKTFKILAILIVCWGIVNYLSENLILFIHFNDDSNDGMNLTAIRFISNILKIVIIAVAIVMIISDLGYNINGLLTGLGVGGLAISLAAQDAVSNLISGFIIIIEKPFVVGDMIQTSFIQGTVEDITMRSTKIRTLDDSLVTTPNSSLTKESIINISKMNKRRILFDIGLEYSTSNDLIKKCENDIRDYLTSNDDILNEPIRVSFSKLDDSSLNLEIMCYTKTSNLDEFTQVLSRVNYEVKKIIEDNKASFAFPSTSVYIEKK